MTDTPIKDIAGIVQSTRDYHNTGVTKSYEWRVKQLKAVSRMMSENVAEWEKALDADLKQNTFLKTTEVVSTITEVDNAISNLKSWMKPKIQPNLTVMNMPGTAMIHKEPYGTVLIISPFNYPISLLTKPLVGALAAGNCAIVKPSELSENVSATFARLIPRYLDTNAVKVILGAIPESTELLKHHFDYILYTGSPVVGKVVMKAAAEHLTPVTLELGGKSPCIVDKDVNMEVAAKRIAWGKFLNLGQTCVAPDYIFVHKQVKAQLIQKLKENVKTFYGNDPKTSNDYSRIISQRHAERLIKLLEGCESKIAMGGDGDANNKYISPTIVDEPNLESKLMREEIFGPILPIMSYDDLDQVIKFINDRPKPLALYLFSSNGKLSDKLINETSSGAVIVNDVVVHNTVSTLPFGGVGNSGMGAYNGEFTFDTFTHQKTVLLKPTWIDPFARYPPYDSNKIAIIRIGLMYSLKGLISLAKYATPAVVGVGIGYYLWAAKL
ncbi:aldehyde dehydrogenase [Acrasis kona]|uniref:Aldehyde dehydrogenase n=1 Tax=Acrasis kona TaxID=1008807 RepID=A0AAW2ZLD2_9EUKA